MPTDKKTCPACQKPNLCGVAQGGESCWCFGVALRLPLGDADQSCYCQDCLERIAEAAGEESAKPPKGPRP